jgi:hypothetical protein
MIDKAELDRTLGWIDAMALLSLDITSYFTTELGIDLFYSDSLRNAAREALSPIEEWGADSHQWLSDRFEEIPASFLEKIASECGDETAEAIQSWFTTVFPDREQKELLFMWSMMLVALVKEWDRALDSGNPLDQPNQVFARMRVRDYVSHKSNVYQEITSVRAVVESDWDKQIDKLKGHINNYTGILVWNSFCSRLASIFWRGFSDSLMDEDTQSLIEWARTKSAAEGRTVESIAIPGEEIR